jgi:hypothetical protein
MKEHCQLGTFSHEGLGLPQSEPRPARSECRKIQMRRSPSGRGVLALAISTVLTVVGLEVSAHAQSGVQVTRDGRRTLISKDVGGERWAITRNEDGTVTGNVFRLDGGEPQFIWCEELSREGGQVRLRCSGSESCDAWSVIGEVTLPESFFAPPAAESATFSLAAEQTQQAGPAGVQTTPDSKRTLVSKDVGGERWAITRHADDGTVTGNVFSPGGGEPQFVWCEQRGQGGPDLAFGCYGASRCAAAPCDPSAWTFIADVNLPASFFAARCSGPTCDGFPRQPGERRTYQVSGGFRFTLTVETVDEQVGGFDVYRVVRDDSPPGIGEYIGCIPGVGEVDVATDYFFVDDPSEGGRSFWSPPLPLCSYGTDVGSRICDWTGVFDDEGGVQTTNVIAYEDVTVPAGTFPNTMKISVVSQYEFDEEPSADLLWIDRDLGLVRREEIGTGLTVELVEYARP